MELAAVLAARSNRELSVARAWTPTVQTPSSLRGAQWIAVGYRTPSTSRTLRARRPQHGRGGNWIAWWGGSVRSVSYLFRRFEHVTDISR